MSTILVWILVIGGSSNRPVTISHPMVDLESCVRLQKSVDLLNSSYQQNQCVQIKMVVQK